MRSSSVHRPWSFACIPAVQRVAASSLQSTPLQVRMRARTCGNQFASFGDCWTGPDANHKQKAKIIIIKSQSLLGKRGCCFDAVFFNGFVRFSSLLRINFVGKWTFFDFEGGTQLGCGALIEGVDPQAHSLRYFGLQVLRKSNRTMAYFCDF